MPPRVPRVVPDRELSALGWGHWGISTSYRISKLRSSSCVYFDPHRPYQIFF